MRQDESTTERKKPLDGLRILIAEDVEDIQVLIKYYLESAGCTVDVAENGFIAAKMAIALPYDLVLMDIQMPTYSGFQAIEFLRKKDFKIPIVALTAYGLKREKETCLELGCDEFLTKPVKPTVLINTISAVMARKTNQEQPEQAIVSNLITDEFIRDNINVFYSNLQKRNLELEEYFKKLDWENVSRTAHKIKGSARLSGQLHKEVSLILAGGYGSCSLWNNTQSMEMTDQFSEIKKLARESSATKITIYQSCFKSSTKKIYYSINGSKDKKVSRQNFVDQTSKVRGDVYLIGHSYGGALAMEMAHGLGKGAKLRGLFTIDPISYKECKPSTFIKSYLRSITYLNPSPGCNRSPRDLRYTHANLRDKADYWHAFYQAEYTFIHSSAIWQAHESTMHSFPEAAWNISGAHGAIDNSAEVWDVITDFVESDLI